jgi:hypothetical protein
MFEIIWHPGAEAALLRIPSWKTAASVDAGVIRFARTGQGDLERVGAYHHLPVVGYVVKLEVDPEAQTINVLAVYRAAPKR